jgi:hypothetical protein
MLAPYNMPMAGAFPVNIRSRTALVLLLLSLLGVLQFENGPVRIQHVPVQHTAEPERAWRWWPWLVSFPLDSSPDARNAAERLSHVLGQRGVVWPTTVNPHCCIWLEIGEFGPNPRIPGYLVILQQGGGRIIASNVEQLDLAIARITEMRTVLDDRRVALPLGVFTNWFARE